MIALTLTTDRLTLRAPDPRDAEAYIAFLATDGADGVGGRKSRRDAWRSFAGILGHWALRGFGQFAIVLKSQNAACGIAGPWRPEGWPEPEFGWSIWSAEHEGQGIAFEAAQAARAHAYETLGWTTAVSYMTPENTRSAALAERLGARRDDDAAKPPVDMPCVVCRHPGPGRLQ